MVVAPVSENTDYAVCARVCAVWLGTYLADSQSFGKKGTERGIQYVDFCHRGGAGFKGAVSASLASELPTLPLALRALAVVPRSCVLHATPVEEGVPEGEDQRIGPGHGYTLHARRPHGSIQEVPGRVPHGRGFSAPIMQL